VGRTRIVPPTPPDPLATPAQGRADMATWCGSSRSNYFTVKDTGAFRVWADQLGIDVWEGDGLGLSGRFAIAVVDGSGWPSTRYSHDGDDVDVDLTAELATHLVDGAVAIIMETGAEKLRYLQAGPKPSTAVVRPAP